jgi:Uri superfamily endonuclease
MCIDPQQIPRQIGTYVLIMKLDETISLQVGRLGRFDLAAGVYAYVGSAQGPGGLRARVSRHLRAEKKLYWHIDALAAVTSACMVFYRVSPERLECAWAQALAGFSGDSNLIPGFGSSDCSCRAHLVKLTSSSLHEAWTALGKPDTLPISWA